MFNKFKEQFDSAKEKAEKTFSESRERLGETYNDVSERVRDRLDREIPETLNSWCSWCGEWTKHSLEVESRIGRSVYQCHSCMFPTVSCRYCDNMAKGASLEVKNSMMDEKTGRDGKVSDFFKDHWNNELCSEHDGTIPDFSRAHEKIDDLSGFTGLMTPKQTNIYGAAKKTATVAGGAAAIGSGAVLAAPGIAAGLGAAGALGAAGTGTTIGSLSGAALTSASVAKLGAGGLAIISATGIGLGGKTGLGIANSYLKDVPDFEFTPLREVETSSNHSIIVVNGFLTEDNKDTEDWCNSLSDYQCENQLWHLNWEAKTLMKLGKWILGSGGGRASTAAAATGFVARGSQALAGRTNAVGLAYTASQMISNPWHSAMVNAEKTGAILAEAISRTEGKTYTLMGHSLGARVVFFALMALATKEEKYVHDAILMGGAVGRDDLQPWLDANDAVEGAIYNCYSDNDDTLRFLYQGANAGLSSPAGLGFATGGAFNRDCTDFISGHNDWKKNLPEVLKRIEASQ